MLELETSYEKLFSLYPTSYETADAYMKWYGAADVLFQRSFPKDDADLLEFRNVENKGDNTVLRENKHRVYSPYMSMIDRLQALSIKNSGDAEPIINEEKKPKLFISHASSDVELVKELVDLFEFIGVKGKDNMLCSSVDGYRIPIGADFVDYLQEQFSNYNLFVIFVHTSNYYNSCISLNEMGAAWAVRSEYYSVLSSDFDFKEMVGVVDNHDIAVKIGSDDCASRLNELKNNIVKFFGLSQPEQERWESKRNDFIKKAEKYNVVKTGKRKKPEKSKTKIQPTVAVLQSLSNTLRLQLVEEGTYHFQLDIKLATTSNVYFKEVILYNENKYVEFHMQNAKGSAVKLLKYVKSNTFDIQSVDTKDYIKAIDDVYKEKASFVEDHLIEKDALETISFHSPIYLKKESDGYDDLPETGWFLRVTYNISGVVDIPLNVKTIK